MRRTLAALFLVLALLAFSVPVQAGGWATVRLDEPPGDVRVDVPWRFGFMVRQHDVTPNSDVTPIIRATHKENGEEITATGRQEGPVGHFVAEITFPRGGDWKWAIAPEPFAETSFEPLHVLEATNVDASLASARIHRGSCADLGETAYQLGAVAGAPMLAPLPSAIVAVDDTTIAVTLATLASSEYAVSIGDDQAGSLVCGDIPDEAPGNEVIIGLQPYHSKDAGIAVLRATGEQTSVTLYLLALNSLEDPSASGPNETIEILDSMAFQPSLLEAKVGTNVTWVNASSVVHTVTGDDLGFDDSGLIDPGQSYSATFDTPGTFHYRCGPHPGMEGVIVIS